MRLLVCFLTMVVMISGCIDESPNDESPNKIVGKDGEFLITKDGGRFCSVDYTTIFFENKTGYVVLDSSGGGYNISKLGGKLQTYPEEFMTIYVVFDENDELIDKPYNLTLPCSWCVGISNDGEVTDLGRSCLSNDVLMVIE